MEIDWYDVDWALKKMKAKKSFEPDGIPSYVYKGLREFLAAALARF